ncbi:MAG TPA: hypothetical protein VMJ90_10655, partial [Anaerolineales bacterium]|nr:hypothetical protein [Anaerolineales bacterium]
MKRISAISFAGLSGLITAVAISTTRYQDQLNTFLDWGITLSLLTLGFGFIYFLLLPLARVRFVGVSQTIKYWAAALLIISALSLGFYFNLFVVIAFILAAFLLVSPGVSALQELVRQGRAPRFILAHIVGAITS